MITVIVIIEHFTGKLWELMGYFRNLVCPKVNVSGFDI